MDESRREKALREQLFMYYWKVEGMRLADARIHANCDVDELVCELGREKQRDALEDALHRLEAWDDDTYCDSPHARWADVGQVRRSVENVKAKYHELLYAVATKHPGESRHETALRYIQQAENRPTYCGAAQDAAPESDGEK